MRARDLHVYTGLHSCCTTFVLSILFYFTILCFIYFIFGAPFKINNWCLRFYTCGCSEKDLFTSTAESQSTVCAFASLGDREVASTLSLLSTVPSWTVLCVFMYVYLLEVY